MKGRHLRTAPAGGGGAVTWRDVTEQRRAEHLLRELITILHASSDALVVVNVYDGMILQWNEAAARLYGYTAAEAIGRTLFMLEPPERPGEISVVLARLRRGRPLYAVDTVRRRKDGTHVEIVLKAFPLRDLDEHVRWGLTMARPISTPAGPPDA